MSNASKSKRSFTLQRAGYQGCDETATCAFDVETVSAPTAPLLHQQSRFIYVIEGQGEIRIQNAVFEMRKGALISILPWQYSEIISVAQPLKYILIVYKFDVINELIKSTMNVFNEELHIISTMSRSSAVYCDQHSSETIENVLDRIFYEVGMASADLTRCAVDDFSTILVNALIMEMMILFNRLLINSPHAVKGTGKTTANIEIFQYIYMHLNEKLTLKRLAAVFFMSESAISKYIQEVSGLSYLELLSTMRITRTMNFLLYTDLTLEQLAKILGYVDASHVSKVFNAKVGMKISEYRKTYSKVNALCGIKENRKAYQMISYIYKSYMEDLTVRQVAERFEMTENEVNAILKYQVERSFDDFLPYVRVIHAAELLLETADTVASIASQVGFNCTKTLIRHFAKIYNTTPNRFRKQIELQARGRV